ncbi:MAG: hypothetical protein CTY18_08510, partial [Methylomonas sp.]
MKNSTKKTYLIKTATAAGAMFALANAVTAWAEGSGAIADLTGYNVNESSLLKDHGFVVGGWANAGITYNTADSQDGFNGPVTFNDRDSEFQLNQ